MIEGFSQGGMAGGQRTVAGRRDSTDILETIDVPVMILVGLEHDLTDLDEAGKTRR